MICWRLQYQDGLLLKVEGSSVVELMYSSFYKLRLRRFAAESSGDTLHFKQSLTYLDMKRIIQLCTQESVENETEVIVDVSLRDFIDAKEIYIEQRAHLGNELKQQSQNLQAKFDAYQATVNRSMIRPLRNKQMWDSFFMCTMRKSGNFSVPGSGKTASLLGMYAYLSERKLAKRIVVICPKNAFGSWMDEFPLCFGEKKPIRCFCLHQSVASSVVARKRAIVYESGHANLLLFNYEALKTYHEEIQPLIDGETLLVYDEVHKVKRIDGEYATWAVRIARQARYLVAMTGTPIPNTYCDIYNFLHILFPDEYEEFFGFEPTRLKAPTSKDFEQINAKIQPFFCRTTKPQLAVPDANPDIKLTARATACENEIFSILQKKYRKNKLPLFIRLLQLESNPQLLLKSLDLSEFRYILDDDVDEIEQIDYVDYSDRVRDMIENIGTTAKFDACLAQAIALANQGKTIVIWCIFKDSIRRFARALTHEGIASCAIFGDVALDDRLALLNDFRTGKYRVLLSNPHTLAESVSLHSICHDAIYFEYSYNLVHLLQSKDRIHRLGLPAQQYTQYYFMQEVFQDHGELFSMDDKIYERLVEKESVMLNAIDHQILESLPSREEDLEMIFAQLHLNETDAEVMHS